MRTKTGNIIKYLWSFGQTQPLLAHFFAYFDPKRRLNNAIEDVLHVICCPAHLRIKVKEEILDEIGKEGICSGVSSKRKMIPERDETFVSVSGGIDTSEDESEVCCLRFVQTF